MDALVTILGVVVTLITLGTLMLSTNRGLEKRVDAKIDRLDAKVDRLGAKVDHVARELGEFRSETREVLARHDERLSGLERERPHLILQ